MCHRSCMINVRRHSGRDLIEGPESKNGIPKAPQRQKLDVNVHRRRLTMGERRLSMSRVLARVGACLVADYADGEGHFGKPWSKQK